MTDKLPPQLLALFAPRPPLRWVQHIDQPAQERKTAAISAVADFLPALHAYKDNDGFTPTESWLQMRDRKKLEKKAQQEAKITEAPLNCTSSPRRVCTTPFFLPSFPAHETVVVC